MSTNITKTLLLLSLMVLIIMISFTNTASAQKSYKIIIKEGGSSLLLSDGYTYYWLSYKSCLEWVFNKDDNILINEETKEINTAENKKCYIKKFKALNKVDFFMVKKIEQKSKKTIIISEGKQEFTIKYSNSCNEYIKQKKGEKILILSGYGFLRKLDNKDKIFIPSTGSECQITEVR